MKTTIVINIGTQQFIAMSDTLPKVGDKVSLSVGECELTWVEHHKQPFNTHDTEFLSNCEGVLS